MHLFKYVIIFILIAIGVISFALVRSGLLTIKKIDIEAKDILCADSDLLRKTSGFLGQNFFLTDFSKIEVRIKNKFSCVKSVSLSKTFPGKVKLAFSPRQPFAKLISLKNEISTNSAELTNIATPSALDIKSSYTIDDEGVTINTVNDDNILKVYVADTEIPMPDLLKILSKIKIFKLDASEAFVFQDYLIISGWPKIIFKLGSKIDTQLASLQLILNEAKIDFSLLEFIDLRFDKPVVKFAPKKNG